MSSNTILLINTIVNAGYISYEEGKEMEKISTVENAVEIMNPILLRNFGGVMQEDLYFGNWKHNLMSWFKYNDNVIRRKSEENMDKKNKKVDLLLEMFMSSKTEQGRNNIFDEIINTQLKICFGDDYIYRPITDRELDEILLMKREFCEQLDDMILILSQ